MDGLVPPISDPFASLPSAALPLHRCRFVDLTPSSTTALALAPSPTPEEAKGWTGRGLLAVGKANGDIEIRRWVGGWVLGVGKGAKHAPGKGWVLDMVIPAPLPASKIDTLHFVRRHPVPSPLLRLPPYTEAIAGLTPSTSAHLRLFSTAGTGALIEWDLDTGKVKRKLASDGGAIWSVAPSPSGRTLALGCADGHVRLVDLSHNGLSHLRILARVPTRLLSLAWGPAPAASAPKKSRKTKEADEEDEEEEDEEDAKEGWIVGGCSDSSLRRWDLASGRVTERMGVDKIRGEQTLVWAVGTLRDGTVVSGDSLGHVTFWDALAGTQLAHFKAHQADVLCLAISSDGSTTFTSGIDQRVSQFALLPSSSPPPSIIQAASRRLHSHDVRALAVSPPPPGQGAQGVPILLSAGLDPHLVLTPAALPSSKKHKQGQHGQRNSNNPPPNPVSTSRSTAFADAWQRRTPFVPIGGRGTVSVCRARRWVVARREGGVGVWRVRGPEEAREEGEGWEKVLDMEVKFKSHTTAHAISPDCLYLAISSTFETKIFHLPLSPSTGLPQPTRLRLSAPLPGASALLFTPDSRRLVLATAAGARVLVLELVEDGRDVRVVKEWRAHAQRGAAASARAVRGLPGKRTEGDGGDVEMRDAEEGEIEEEEEEEEEEEVKTSVHLMAASPDGQWLATTDLACRTHLFSFDSLQHHATLPSHAQPISALSFHPLTPSLLVLGQPSNALTFYDADLRSPPAWSRALTSRGPPAHLASLVDPLQGIAFNPSPHAIPPSFPSHEASAALDPAREHTLLLWGASWICRVRLDRSAGRHHRGSKRGKKASAPANEVQRKARELWIEREREAGRAGDEDEADTVNFRLATRYEPIVFLDFVGDSELCVVERPGRDFVGQLPAAFWKGDRYGT